MDEENTSVSDAAAAQGRKKSRPGVEEQTVIIMRAAVELFIDKGTRTVSIAQICNYADVSRPTFYRCFTDKDALVAKIYDEAVNQYVGQMLETGLSHNPDDKNWLQLALDDLLEAIFAKSQLAQLVFIDSNDPGSPAAAIVDQAFDHAAERIRASMGKYGLEKPSPVYLKAMMAAVQWMVYNAIKQGLDEQSKNEAKKNTFLLVQKSLLPAAT